MIINWKPSSRLVEKMEKIYKLHQTLSYKEIAKALDHSRAYVITLNSWYQKNLLKEIRKEVN